MRAVRKPTNSLLAEETMFVDSRYATNQANGFAATAMDGSNKARHAAHYHYRFALKYENDDQP